jgi:hypothetical protein
MNNVSIVCNGMTNINVNVIRCRWYSIARPSAGICPRSRFYCFKNSTTILPLLVFLRLPLLEFSPTTLAAAH